MFLLPTKSQFSWRKRVTPDLESSQDFTPRDGWFLKGKLGAQVPALRWRHPSNAPPLTSQLPASASTPHIGDDERATVGAGSSPQIEMAPPVKLLAFLGEDKIFLGENKNIFRWRQKRFLDWDHYGLFCVIVTRVPGNEGFGGNWAGLNENWSWLQSWLAKKSWSLCLCC